MADFKTERGIPVKNFTRYETADLVALCNLVEERIIAVTGNIWTKGYAPSPATSITFKDFATRIHYLRRRLWNNGYAEQREVRNYTDSHGSWGNIAGTVKIVPPAKIHLDPLEALAADSTKVPRAVVEAIYAEIVSVYSSAREAEKAVKVPVPDTFQVRINNRRAQKRDKVGDFQSLCRANLRRKYWNSSYYAGRAIDGVRKCMKNMKVAGVHAKRCGESSPDLTRLQEILDELEQMKKSFNDKAHTLGGV